MAVGVCPGMKNVVNLIVIVIAVVIANVILQQAVAPDNDKKKK